MYMYIYIQVHKLDYNDIQFIKFNCEGSFQSLILKCTIMTRVILYTYYIYESKMLQLIALLQKYL